MTTWTAPRLSIADPAAIARLADRLKAADFQDPRIFAMLGLGRGESLTPADTPLFLRGLPDRGLLPTLVRLFTLGCATPADVLNRELAPLTVDDLESMGLVETGPGGVEPKVRLCTYNDLLLASDPLF